MISFFCCEFTSFQIGHHSFCASVNLDKSVLDRCHCGNRQDLFSTSELVRVEQLKD
jgi:hypothetical protein